MSKTSAIKFTRAGWLPVLVAAVMSLLTFSPVHASAAGTSSISGTYASALDGPGEVCSLNVAAYDSSGAIVGSSRPENYLYYNVDYRIGSLESGVYTVEFNEWCLTLYPEYRAFSHTERYKSPVSVTQGASRTGINILRGQGGSISGTVTDTTGNPLDGICVESYDRAGNAGAVEHTTDDGTYDLDDLTTGEYRLNFSDCANADSDLIPKFYDDTETLADAVPVSATYGEETPGIDVQMTRTERATPDPFTPETTVRKASISDVKVKGPTRVRKGRMATYRVKVRNSGKAGATGVRLKVKGRGIRHRKLVGEIAAGSTRTVRVRLKPKKSGKAKLAFRVTSSNAGVKSTKKRVAIKKARSHRRTKN